MDSHHQIANEAALVGKWTRSPFEYSKVQDEEDSMAIDSGSSSMNEGIKSRTPRVNFVTQQKKSIDDDTKSSASKFDSYKSPPLIHSSKESTAASSSSERYPESSTTRPSSTYPDYNNRDVTTNRYDDRYIEDMYPPPRDSYDPMYDFYEPYDPYVRRFPPYGGYNSYNNYHSRYDIPDYRDYPPMYGNEIDSRFHMRSDMPLPLPPSPPRKRTIFYAYLPEVVRSPPTVDSRYRSYDRYDPYYYDHHNSYEPYMSGTYRRPPPEKQALTEKSAVRTDYHRTSRPMKITSDESMKNSSMPSIKEKRYDQDQFYDDPYYTRPYSHRRPMDYDPYYYY